MMVLAYFGVVCGPLIVCVPVFLIEQLLARGWVEGVLRRGILLWTRRVAAPDFLSWPQDGESRAEQWAIVRGVRPGYALFRGYGRITHGLRNSRGNMPGGLVLQPPRPLGLYGTIELVDRELILKARFPWPLMLLLGSLVWLFLGLAVVIALVSSDPDDAWMMGGLCAGLILMISGVIWIVIRYERRRIEVTADEAIRLLGRRD